MAKTPFAGLVTPEDEQKVAVPADMWRLAYMLDMRLNLLAEDENDRNSRYQDVRAGTRVTTPDGWEWVKTSSPPDTPTWFTVASKEFYTGFTWSNGFEDAGESVIKKCGPNFDCFIGAIYNGASVIGPAGPEGGLDDVRICQISDASWRPQNARGYSVNGGASFGGQGICWETGTINLTHAYPGSDLNPGDTVAFGFNYMRI